MSYLWKALGIPEPLPEFKFHPTRKWRFDWAWPDKKIALEIEGGAWVRGRHVRGMGYIKDLEKYSQAAILGWCVIRVVPEDQWTTGALLIKEAFGRRKKESGA